MIDRAKRQRARRRNTRERAAKSPRNGGPNRNKAKPDAAAPAAVVDKEDVVHGVEPVNRESSAVQGETGIEQYGEIVEKYFKAITKPAAAKPMKP